MHPIEHLRYVARARGADPASLVRETASALRAMQFDPAGLVVACRRIVERHPTSGPLWWLCAHVLTSNDPVATGKRLVDEIDDDPTAALLADALPDAATVVVAGWPETAADALFRRGDATVLVLDAGRDGSGLAQRLERADIVAEALPAEAAAAAVAGADLVLVDTWAACDEAAIVGLGGATLAAAAYCAGTPVWLVAGVGRRLPLPMWSAMRDRLAARGPAWAFDEEILAVDLVAFVAGPRGVVDCAPGALAPECPLAAELARSTPA